MHGSDRECGLMTHNIHQVDPETDVRVCPMYFSEMLSDATDPEEWTLIATVDMELGIRCLRWATTKGIVCQLRNWPVQEEQSDA